MFNSPKTVPWMTVPFLSSTVTVSLLSFIRNLRGRKTATKGPQAQCGSVDPASTPQAAMMTHLGCIYG